MAPGRRGSDARAVPRRARARVVRIRLARPRILYGRLDSPLGPLLALSSAGRLAGLYFADEARRPRIRPDWVDARDTALFRQAARQLDEYFAGTRQVFDVPLDLHGTRFQSRVWRALSAIPYGRVMTYGAIARGLRAADAARAVGAAVGRNPIGIIVPCHRAVAAAGGLAGYGGGLGRKRALLDLERAE